jgi:hypothetical protein
MTTPLPFIDFHRPVWDFITAVGMLILVGSMSLAWVAFIRRQSRIVSVWVVVILMVVLIANLVGDHVGLFRRMDLLPPPFVVLVLLCLGISVGVGMGYLGKIGDDLVRTMSIESLVALQIFRLPLELLMLRAAHLGIMPIEFSMLGYNVDVLTGLGALLIFAYCLSSKSLPIRAVWLWNVFGVSCLIAIGVLAALTSPNLHVFGADAKHVNSWVLYFPYSLLPTVLVAFAVFGHVLLTRKLFARGRLSRLLPG